MVKVMMLDIQVFAPSRNFDSKYSAQFRTEITNISLKKPDVLIVDMHNVTFIDSNGLGTLFAAIKLTKAHGGRLVICSLAESVRFLLEVTETSQYFEIFATREEALKAIVTTQLEDLEWDSLSK
ncbi:STAS domain-containing protein [Tumidithrix elongata RA019]|uniref:Anti-sigma factor antagonist n=1 Tax=Tumidithrix elongata BACA0141 TaxID=2716417 RepID=A0AAW9PT30_9CYAN|nr:STAS domain-containing protein [Tumidithrix elongata RA019]